MKFSNDPLFVTRAAKFSADRRYRYSLEIVWDATKPLAAFIGLNPSTADETQDDPTIRRCRGFAESWGCGGLRMLNLFAFRATDPESMKAEGSKAWGEADCNRLYPMLEGVTGPKVACWGTHGKFRGQGPAIAYQFQPILQCLGLNADGSPKHPLYLKADTPLQPFSKVAQ